MPSTEPTEKEVLVTSYDCSMPRVNNGQSILQAECTSTLIGQLPLLQDKTIERAQLAPQAPGWGKDYSLKIGEPHYFSPSGPDD